MLCLPVELIIFLFLQVEYLIKVQKMYLNILTNVTFFFFDKLYVIHVMPCGDNDEEN